jgi:aspartyl-tRNA(Asn)/glutamyl-tRNA(Gln) amidotransferase subunit C
MIITKELVAKLAHLARMKLTEEEMEKFAGQLDEIMTFFEKLQQVDTSDVEPVSQITGLTNITRKDVPHDSVLSNALLECSPKEDCGRQIRVQKTL